MIGGGLLRHPAIIPLIAMIVLICLNLAIHLAVNLGLTQRMHRKRAAEDALRLRAALHAELCVLREVYWHNHRLIGRSSRFLMSGRPYFSVYRANLSRIALLPEPAAIALVSAYACNERIETWLVAHGRGTGGPVYRFRPNEDLTQFRIWMQRGVLAVDAALAALVPPAPEPAPAPEAAAQPAPALAAQPG